MAKVSKIVVDRDANIIMAWGVGAPPADYLPGVSSGWHNRSNGDVYTLNGSNAWIQLGVAGAGSASWASITGKPTTIAGFGITDAFTQTAADARYWTQAQADGRYLQLAGGTLTGAVSSSSTFSATRFISTQSTGTAPFTVSSTTLVSNLNAQYLNGHADSYFATASSLGGYLPLSGGTLTGPLNGTYAWFSGQLYTSSNINGDYTAGFYNAHSGGYGVHIRINNDAIDSFRITNAANTKDTIRLFGDGSSQFAKVTGIGPSSTSDITFQSLVYGDGYARWYKLASGAEWWGSGTATADTNLYRYSSNVLKTDGAFIAAGDISAFGNGYVSRLYQSKGTGTNYETPTLTISTDAAPSSSSGYPEGHIWIQVTAPL